MFWGNKAKDSGVSSGRALSRHVDDWEDLAVDYVDGRLDQSTEAAVKQHLGGCPGCASRLETQRGALAMLRGATLVDAPAGLEDQILGEVLFPRESAQTARRAALEEPSRWSPLWRNKIKPWVPATAVLVVLLAVVVAVGVVRQGARLSDEAEMTTVVAADAAAEAAAAGALQEADSATVRTASTTAPAVGGMGESTTATELTLGAPNYTVMAADLQPSGPYLKDREEMAGGLATASAPAYFFFDGDGESLITVEQADAIAGQVTGSTGLELMDETLSSGTRVFAAFVPREDASAVVDLLRAIGASLQLAVSLSLQPGPAVTAWAESLLEDKSALAELSARPIQPPAIANWAFTTSTSPPTTEGNGETPKAVPLDEAGTHVLVVILMNTQM